VFYQQKIRYNTEPKAPEKNLETIKDAGCRILLSNTAAPPIQQIMQVFSGDILRLFNKQHKGTKFPSSGTVFV